MEYTSAEIIATILITSGLVFGGFFLISLIPDGITDNKDDKTEDDQRTERE